MLRRYFTSNIHVGLSLMFLTLLNRMYFPSEKRDYYPLFVLVFTVAGYHIIRLVEGIRYPFRDIGVRLGEPEKSDYIIIGVSIAGVTGYLICCGSVHFMLSLVPALVLSAAYAVPAGLSGRIKSLRYNTWIRLAIIGSVWAWVSLGIPALAYYRHAGYWLLMLSEILLVAVWVIPFDIFDMSSDYPYTFTLPRTKSIAYAKRTGALILLLSWVIRAMIYTQDTPAVNIITDAVMYLYTLVLLANARSNQSEYYAAAWVDGIPVVIWLFYQAINLIS